MLQGAGARGAARRIALGLTLAVVSLIGYSAMVGAVGGGGLGDLGIRYGYQRFMPDVMAGVVVVLIVLVQTRAERRRPAGAPPQQAHRRKNHVLTFIQQGDIHVDIDILAAALGARSRRRHRAAAPRRIKIGVTPGPHAQILEKVKPIAAKKGLDIKIVEFSDYVVPNQALDAGELEANSFQHQPYLDNQVDRPRLQDRERRPRP